MNSSYKDDTLKARLPVEVILLIIENLIPGTTHRRPILPASHVVTKTLLNLTLVSKAIYPLSSRLLWQNCLRIESKESLRLFRDFVSRESIVTGWRPCDAHGSTRLFLCPFSRPRLHSPVPVSIDEEARGEAIYDPVYSPVSPYYPELKDYDTIEAVNEVLITLAPVLKAIIVDMPLRSLYPEDDDTGIRRLLREGFEALVNVEELVSINDELYLDTKEDQSEPEVWTKWPKLQRLALYNVVTEPGLWKNMLLCPQLEMAVLSRSDGSEGGTSEEDIKDQWSRAWTEATSQGTMTFEDRVPYQGREVIIAFCDWDSSLPKLDALTHRWERLDPDNLIWIMTVPFDQPYNPALTGYAYQYPDVPKNWIRGRALRGSLWEDVYTERCDSTSKSD
ncbi:hypothetical protein FLAG1_01914 [Fusarium langsethiae]|uniref:F-box domain-containing protein n=1 Tax=Fusarium langsethiae TaxID=179993 RepID=A0A0M9F3C7_FUSLA|nr:hypothetical protein FLAG1_01914 [Fusarium langsethiae]GKU02126.1 unnamed protein product [Fusarium langsethiae]GKU19503.1 unnamed protein product [Fusarium langsethiae]